MSGYVQEREKNELFPEKKRYIESGFFVRTYVVFSIKTGDKAERKRKQSRTNKHKRHVVSDA
jgi:hypothetical protein